MTYPSYPAYRARRAKRNPGRLIDAVRPGDRVTIVNRFGQQRSGRAVMPAKGGIGWVLNMGGPHGTPGIATDENTVRVTPSKARHGGGHFGSIASSSNPVHTPGIFVTPQGRNIKVRFTAQEVRMFRRIFPGSGLQDRSYWFEFDASGDLVDTDVPQQDDGPGASALAEDAKAYAFEDKVPEWQR